MTDTQHPPATPPPATGVRLHWQDLPPHVRAAVEQRWGSPVTAATTQPGGFSPGVAARLQSADGRRLFLKAVGPTPNPAAAELHRREAQIVAALPAGAPVPRLHWCHDEDGWVLLAFEDVAGRQPHQPWRDDELAFVLDALHHIARLLTPTPLQTASASDRFEHEICGWRELQRDPPDTLDPWSRRHLAALAALEAGAAAAVTGETLLHLDIRADNLLLTPERVLLVDWPHACVGAPWVDLLFFAPSVEMQGGPPPEPLLDRYLPCRDADPDALTATLAAIAGFFTHRALQPPPPGLPTLRPFQAAQGAVARRWLARRRAW